MDANQLQLLTDGALWRDVTVVPRTGSTNADLLERARAGAAEGLVLVAEEQTAGRGRLGRSWSAPAGAALTFSVLLRPAGVPPTRLGWLPLLTGVAVVTAVRDQAGVPASLKWPNDVLVGERKLAGILAEAHGGAVVVGVGLNVTLRPADLPVPAATSLLIEGAASTGRTSLLAAILAELGHRYQAWRADPDAPDLRQDYLRWSATVGREVRVELPGGAQLSGTAEDVDEVGRLVVRTPGNLVRVGAGDVVHVR
jgi:BirA family transcriptional regulator, biotin operon repressor / biotin---[acetyl-CoA-carboxylase] ligase